jgi:hypothetical protein
VTHLEAVDEHKEQSSLHSPGGIEIRLLIVRLAGFFEGNTRYNQVSTYIGIIMEIMHVHVQNQRGIFRYSYAALFFYYKNEDVV